MEQRQPPIYHSCLQLSRLVFSITRHFPKKANYEEGAELRRASVEAVKECLLANRSQRGSPDRKHHQERLADALTLIEALVSVINEEKMCVQTKCGLRNPAADPRPEGRDTCIFLSRNIDLSLPCNQKKNSSYDTGHERKDTVLHGSDDDCLRRRPRLYMLLPEPLQD